MQAALKDWTVAERGRRKSRLRMMMMTSIKLDDYLRGGLFRRYSLEYNCNKLLKE